ncbi:hypothetical protein ACULNC_04315 [Shigella flexneri]
MMEGVLENVRARVSAWSVCTVMKRRWSRFRTSRSWFETLMSVWR